MCNMCKKFGQLLRRLTENPLREGSDFIDYCLENGIGASDASELMERNLGLNGDEFLTILLK